MTTNPIKPELRGTDADREAEPSIRDALDKTEKGKPVGTFFVRESASQPGCYAITMQRDAAPWHGLITPSVNAEGNTLYKLFVKQKFERYCQCH